MTDYEATNYGKLLRTPADYSSTLRADIRRASPPVCSSKTLSPNNCRSLVMPSTLWHVYTLDAREGGDAGLVRAAVSFERLATLCGGSWRWQTADMASIRRTTACGCEAVAAVR